MNESTARAEQYDLQVSPSLFYLWEAPQQPVAVRIPYELMDRLEREAMQSFRSVTSRGSEIGGFLLGSVTAESPTVLSIDDFQLVEPEYSRGPLYRLSESDMDRFRNALGERAAEGVNVAGFFRTHTRKGICLDSDDIALLDMYFRDPHQIALLVRPFATKASIGGVFLRESGNFSSAPSALEFPFRSKGADGRVTADAVDAKVLTAVPAPPPKPAIRAQIVPIASRRDLATPGAIEDRPELAAVPDMASAVVSTTPAEGMMAEAVEAASAISVPAVGIRKDSEEPASRVAEEPAEASRFGKGLKLVLAALAAAALFVVLFVYPGVLNKGRKNRSAQAQDSSPLQLHVERANGELLLTWNRDSEAIRNANKAILSIADGEQHENVELDLAQLRNGSIVYSPQGSDISFKMEVTGQAQDRTASESVRVLRTRPSPLRDQPPAAASTTKPNQSAPVTAEKSQDDSPANTPATETNAQEVSRPVPPTRPFKTESLSQRLRPAPTADLPDAPAVGTAHLAPATIAGVNVTGVAPTPPTAPPASPAVTPEVKTGGRFGGQIQQAVLISRKEPEYPRLAKQNGARGMVKLSATIGKDGRVKGVKMLSGHPMLQMAAKDAVLQWIYRPTLLNGQAVESDVEVVLNFLSQ